VLEPAAYPDPPDAAPPVVLPIERAAAALEVILCSGYPTQIVVVNVLNTFGMHPWLLDGRLSPLWVFTSTLADTLLLVGLVVFFLRAHRESPREQLFGSRRARREIGVGIVLIPASFFLATFLLLFIRLSAPTLRNVLHNPLGDLVQTRGDALLFAFVVTVAGGVREEIQRGFVLRRFEQYLGGGVAGLVMFSTLFGLGHLEQGRDVAIATAVLGVFWGAVFLRRRSIVAPMIAHTGFDLAEIVQIMVLGA